MLKLLALFKPDPGHTLTHIEKDASFWLVSADQGRIFRKVTESVGALAAIVMGMQFILHGYHPYRRTAVSHPSTTIGDNAFPNRYRRRAASA